MFRRTKHNAPERKPWKEQHQTVLTVTIFLVLLFGTVIYLGYYAPKLSATAPVAASTGKR